jgi:hypothetical protein
MLRQFRPGLIAGEIKITRLPNPKRGPGAGRREAA